SDVGTDDHRRARGHQHHLPGCLVAHGRLCTQAVAHNGCLTFHNGRLSPELPRRIWRLSVLYILCWMIALATHDPGGAEATDWMKPPTWSGNYWGPAATR